jgi:hypothetical protein
MSAAAVAWAQGREADVDALLGEALEPEGDNPEVDTDRSPDGQLGTHASDMSLIRREREVAMLIARG